VLSSLRPNGINRIIGRRETLFLGTLRADEPTGLNEFRYRTAPDQPLLCGTVHPRQTLVVDPTLVACVECGNGNTEPPEECDDGNQNDGDGCSRSCMIEEIIVGDANGDLEVDEGDLDAVIAEIFDGDGDSVADVGSPEGSFAGGPGADANENERIEAADLSAIVGIIFE
jgi:cysteine-rich repeat protein